MNNNEHRTDYTKELRFLFNSICEEMKEYRLTYQELDCLFKQFIVFILIDRHHKTANKILTGDFDFSKESIEELIAEVRTLKSDFTKYQFFYFFKYFGEKNHLKNITQKYLSLYQYPKYDKNNKSDTEGMIQSIRFFGIDIHHKYPFSNFIVSRTKDDDNCSNGWHLLMNYSCDADIHLENVAFVWPCSEGTFRFVTKDGKWGFVIDRTFEIIYLPRNVIQLYDFCCLRARVLMSDEDKVMIHCDNKIYEDDNPSNLYWGYIDMRGKIISKEKYTYATDYENDVATVSTSSLGWDWPSNYGVESPYYHNQIDLFGEFTDECKKRREELFDERQRREKRKDRMKFYKQMFCEDLDDDEIIDSISNGNGDIWGYGY